MVSGIIMDSVLFLVDVKIMGASYFWFKKTAAFCGAASMPSSRLLLWWPSCPAYETVLPPCVGALRVLDPRDGPIR